MRRGEVYRASQALPERGDKPGFYVVVSRDFVADNEDISTVICAPVYSRVLGIRSEVELGPEDGLPRQSAVRCDFLTLMFKKKLTRFVAALSADRVAQLDSALAYALLLELSEVDSARGS